MNEKKYISIICHYEETLSKFGDSHLGVDWPKAIDVETRYAIMLGIINNRLKKKVKILDFGCGASHLYDYLIRKNMLKAIDYHGLDMSEKFISLSKSKYPEVKYFCQDINENYSNLGKYDYVILNGVFTEKCNLSFEEMFLYFKDTITNVQKITRIGFAFNVMSKQVDWERTDLFHLSFDLLADFLTRNISRHFVIRHDYGLYEYTTYVYQNEIHV
ncbi:MAG: methyltransferase domain-containing protein [Candidatus Cloacimonetes bacterium]|nr:methyltransferase domain-containing protein [Candidatus Cloacimonadota bacterium]